MQPHFSGLSGRSDGHLHDSERSCTSAHRRPGGRRSSGCQQSDDRGGAKGSAATCCAVGDPTSAADSARPPGCAARSVPPRRSEDRVSRARCLPRVRRARDATAMPTRWPLRCGHASRLRGDPAVTRKPAEPSSWPIAGTWLRTAPGCAGPSGFEPQHRRTPGERRVLLWGEARSELVELRRDHRNTPNRPTRQQTQTAASASAIDVDRRGANAACAGVHARAGKDQDSR